MNRIVDLIKTTAGLEKKAYSQAVTTFSANSIAALVRSGMPFEKAASLVSDACEKEESLCSKAERFLLLEKIAEYVETIESQNAELIKAASEVKKEVPQSEADEQMAKLASLGFSRDEIQAMKSVDSSLIEKVASVTAAPEAMGAGVGIPREKTDPLLDFILA